MSIATETTPQIRDSTTEVTAAAGGFAVTLCFAAATFLGAFLLFLVQPLIAKYILPWFGGGAAVWTTCMLFFQTALLAGYLYAHLGAIRLPTKAQAVVHVLVLVAAVALALPAIAPSTHWKPPVQAGGANPTWRILSLLTATLGLPCIALAATSPLLHAWYSRLRPGAAVYRLYALSNVGSLLALLAYPLVVERFLPRHVQAMAWSAGLAAFAVLCAGCALLAARHRGKPNNDGGVVAETDLSKIPVATPAATGVVRALLWLLLPACATALLLGATNSITQDLAPVPFLWILPLALYLLTFIIAFDHPRWYRRTVFAWLLAASAFGAILVLFSNDSKTPLALAVAGILPVLFIGCMVMHGELARLKPPPRRLTSYYLTIAAGGAIGGLLVAVAAPLLTTSYSEFPAAMWVCCLLAFVAPYISSGHMPRSAISLVAFTAIALAAPVLWFVAHRPEEGTKLIAASRDYYGVLRLLDVDRTTDKGTILRHGRITHGFQFRRKSLRGVPTTYYHQATGVGLVLGRQSPLPQPRRVGVVGLGAGTLAAYANAGDFYRFYEISPRVLQIANEAFTYVEDLRGRGATWEPVLGDARLSMEREGDQAYDVLVLDAFSGDAIPVHTLTREAFSLYKRHLKPAGVLCVHTSNHYLDLEQVVAAAAAELGWEATLFTCEADENTAAFAADWIVLSPDPQTMEQIRRLGEHRRVNPSPGFSAWTDEHANLLGILR